MIVYTQLSNEQGVKQCGLIHDILSLCGQCDFILAIRYIEHILGMSAELRVRPCLFGGLPQDMIKEDDHG